MNLALIFKHFFIPRESNNQKARILHAPYLVFLLFVVIIYQFGIQVVSAPPIKILGYASNISVDQIIKLTNEKREENGLPPLTQSPLLTQAAQEKVHDMFQKGYWAHVAPDGTQPWKFFEDVGYTYKYAGENLARDFKDPASAVNAWMASLSHRENLLSPKYKEIGIAVMDGQMAGSDTTIIVQLFGTKLSEATQVTPVAAAPIPSAIPTPQPALAKVTPSQVTVKATQVSSFDVTKYASLALTVMLGLIIMVDAIIVARKNIIRVGGRPLAHLSFIGMIIAILIIAKAGKIL
jgi:hypothetical protein